MILPHISDEQAIEIARLVLGLDKFIYPVVERGKDENVEFIEVSDAFMPEESKDVVEIDQGYNINCNHGHMCRMVDAYKIIFSIMEANELSQK